MGVLGLPKVQESKGEEDQDSDDSTETVTYSPPKSVVCRSKSVQLPSGGGAKQRLRRASSLQPLAPAVKVGVKKRPKNALSQPKAGGGIVKKRGGKRLEKLCLRGRGKGRNSCDC